MNKVRSVAIGIRNINTKSGLGKIVLEQVNYYLQESIDVVIYTSKYDKQIASTGVKIIKIQRIPFLSQYYQRFSFAKIASYMIKKKGYDLVIGHGDLIEQDIIFLHNLVERAYKETHKKTMSPLNNIAKLRRHILTTQSFKLLIANSELMKNELMTSFQIPDNKIKVIYPGYEPKQFNVNNHHALRKESRLNLGIEDNTLLIGFITSGDFKKRALDLFIEALKKLDTTHDYKILLVGKDKSLPTYMQLAEKYGLKDKFILKEPIGDVQNYFHAVDFTVHSAHFEEFGMVVQEAMACGLPVITSKKVGASEIFLNKDLIIDTPDVDSLQQKMQLLINDVPYRQSLREGSLRSVEKTTWKSYIDNFIAFSQKI